MKEILRKHYNIEIEDYKEYNEGIVFFISGSYYLFTKCHYDEKYIDDLVNICNKLREKVKLHDFVYNKDGKVISEDYILFKINVLLDDIDENDIYNFNYINGNEYIKDYIFMDTFWEEKIDYLEMQLSEFSNNKLINHSFDYYVGIGEILISFLKKNFNRDNVNLCLSHRCLNNLKSIDFYNPLNISFDLPLKDMASYIRITNNEELLMNIIDKNVDKSYLFVRMVFPFMYFDEVSNIIVDKNDNKKLIEIVNGIDKYEEYIGRMEKLFGIYLFSWIKKE